MSPVHKESKAIYAYFVRIHFDDPAEFQGKVFLKIVLEINGLRSYKQMKSKLAY